MSKKKSHYSETGLVFEEMEPRLLLSADPLAVATDANEPVQQLVLEENDDQSPTMQFDVEQSRATQHNELVIIDSRAPNYQQLHNDLIKAQQQGRNIQVVVLDAHRDGVEQISAALENYDRLDAMHIVSHGEAGQLLLGTTQLNTTTLREHMQAVSQWKDRFSDSGDLLIYGCKLAETAEGRSLATVLGHLTATDVAASDDLTGHEILGGDWDLEYTAGQVETSVAFSDQVQQTWRGTLQAATPAGTEQQQAQAVSDQQQQADIQAELAEHQAPLKHEAQDEDAGYREDERAADTEEQRQEIIFVDWTVNDFGSLVEDLQRDSDGATRFDIILLDTESDGIEQIGDVLADYRDVDAVHIISHGDDGAIKLGDTWLNAVNIDQYSESLMAWADSLEQYADILIYGCNLAESTSGENFVDQLARLTGADVAASDDLTGHAARGGDWELEYRAGSVETAVAIDEAAQTAFQDTLSTFVVSNTNATGAGSLHQAILDANANTGIVDTISFDISGAGPHIISLTGPLPVITEAVIIDGTSEPDFSYAGDGSPRPVVVIDGSGAGAADGIVIGPTGGGSTIRGLVIQNFQNDGILLLGGNNTITASILGLQADGVTMAGNNLAGTGIHGNIRIESSNNVIGGLTAAERNIISGSGFSGIALFGAAATGNQILGNYIGTDISGTLARGNAQEGIEIQDAGGNIIGGTVAGARNIISANGSDGMEIDNGDNNTIQGNFIGTDVTGTLALGNARDGIDINENAGAGATGNLIGGTDPNAANLIANNGIFGVEARDAPTVNNAILGNRIYANGQLGIQLSNDGVVTLNDAGDGDGDSNNLQNFPVLTAADTNTVDTIVIDGTLNSAVNSHFRIEFFASSTGDASGYGEGENYLGYVNVTTDASGNASFSASLSATVAHGAVISATATRSDAGYSTFTDTSEFAANINAVANFSASATNDPQDYSTYLNSLGPTGYWRLGEAAGGTAFDATGLNNGSYNGVTLGQAGAISADGDTALLFDGVDDYMSMAHDPAYLLDDGTVQFWFNTADVSQRADLFSKDASGFVNGGHLSIFLDGSGNIETRLQSASADYFVRSTSPLANNQWHHVAFTFGAGGMQLYVDGQLQDSDAYTGGLGTTSGGSGNIEPIAIGASTQLSAAGSLAPLQDYFSGYMDEVALFGTALTADQIRNLYAGGVQNYTVAEDNTLNVSAAEGVLINDFDQEGDSLTAVLVSGPSNAAAFTLYNDGSFDYTPAAHFNGTDSFTYMAHDGTSASNTATVTITVTAENDVPVASANTVTTGEDVPYSFAAADFSFSDVEGDSLVAARITNLNLAGGTLTYGGGTAVVSGNTLTGAQLDTLIYTPAAHSNGSPLAWFDFTVNDAGAGVVTAQMSIDVTPANDLPQARDDRIGLVFDGVDDHVVVGDYAGLIVTTNMTMEAWIRPTGLGSGTKIIVNKEGEYEMAINAGTGEVMWAFDNIDPDWSWHYTGFYVQPDDWTHLAVTYDNGVVNTYANGVLVDSYNGSGSITDNYPAFNQLQIGGRENTTTQRFDGQIDEVRIWNSTRSQLDIQTNMNTQLGGAEPGLIGNWRFDEGSGITVQDHSAFGHHGTLANGINAAEMPAWQGYVVNEDGTLNVSAVNGVLANDFDIDGDPMTAVLVAGPSNASAFTLNPDGSFTYSPVANFNGVDSFSYRANDGSGDSNIATVTIRVDPVNDVPVATANSVSTSEDTAYSFSSTDFTYSDVEGDSLFSATITNLSLAGGTLMHSGGMAVSNGDSLTAAQLDTLVYTPASNANGLPLATFDFSVNDSGSGVTSAQMSINVTAVNDVPVATANTVTTTENTAHVFNAAEFTYTDVEGDALTSATITNLSLAGGTLTHSGGITVNNGDTLSAFQLNSLTYTPAVNTTGAPLASFDFSVNDAGAGAATAQMAIDVNPVNNAPVAIANTVSTSEDTAYHFAAADFTYSDAESDALVSATITNLSLAGGTLAHSGGVAVNNGDTLTAAQLDTLVFTPVANANGAPLASFDFTVNDSSTGVVSATMSINVTAQPDPALIAGVDSGSVTEDVDPDMNNLLEVSGSLTITDPDAGEALFNAGVYGGVYGVITLNASGDWDYAANNTQAAVQGLASGATLTDTITVSSVDGTSHAIVITITGTNDAPLASAIADVTVDEDAAATSVDLHAAFDDLDNLDTDLNYTIVGNTNIGLFSSVGIDAVTGRLTLDYAADMNGAAQITVRAADPDGLASDTVFSVTVIPVNDDPVLTANSGVTATPATPARIGSSALNASDVDNTTAELVYTVTTLPANGELLLNGAVVGLNDSFTQADIDSNRLEYQPLTAGATDRFVFTLTDGAGGTLADNTFNILVQLTPDDDDDTESSPPPSEPEQEEPAAQQQATETVITDFNEGTSSYGGGFEPFGSTSAPPVPPPSPVVNNEPAPPAEPVQPIEAPEVQEYTATEVEDYKVTTFAAAQVKSMTALWSAIDQMKQEMAETAEKQTSAVEIRVATAETTGVVLTAGVVAWILRSGALFSSLISTIPLWKGYDPLPILAYEEDEEDNEDTIDENKIPTSMDDLKKLKEVIKRKEQESNGVDLDSMFGGDTMRE